MAASPDFKVYRDGEYVASCKYAEDAAAVVGMSGGTVKYRHKHVVWRDGEEAVKAEDSWDHAGKIMNARVEALYRKHGTSEQEN